MVLRAHVKTHARNQEIYLVAKKFRLEDAFVRKDFFLTLRRNVFLLKIVHVLKEKIMFHAKNVKTPAPTQISLKIVFPVKSAVQDAYVPRVILDRSKTILGNVFLLKTVPNVNNYQNIFVSII